MYAPLMLFGLTSLLGKAEGWTLPMPTSTTRPHKRNALYLTPRPWDTSTLENHNNNNFDLSSRRQWLVGVSQAATAVATVLTSNPALADTPIITSQATCDTTVTVWKRGDRVIYLLGTAHISEVSSELAGQLVRDTRPNAVFVELDLKRVAGPNAMANANRQLTVPPVEGQTRPTRVIIPDVVNYYQQSGMLPVSSSTTSSETAIASTSATSSLPAPQPRGIQSTMINAGAAAVGNAIRSMYKNLGQAGFNPGEEFVTAILEGQKVGADVVLGDQDVEITLQRLTQALAVTDVRKLLNPDSELEKSMSELMGMQKAPALAPEDPNNPAAFKQGLTTFVESIKTRETVRKIMSQLNQIAPALVQVMLTERDAYMAAGLDSLQEETVIVAVMGIAHADGVESNLKSKGWSQARLNCPKRS